MTWDQLQPLLIFVVALDVLIVAGIVVRKLARRRSARQEAAASRATSTAPVSGGPIIDAQAGEALDSPKALDSPREPGPAATPTAAEYLDVPPPPSDPAGLNFGPPWVDPITVYAEAAAEWRRALRRETARAARSGRAATIMQLDLEVDFSADRSGADVSRAETLLLGLVSSRVRSIDYLARTGPGRFHLILPEMSEAAAMAAAERIRREFSDQTPDGPRLLIGWVGTLSEDGLASALQRVAERVQDERRRLRAADELRAAEAETRPDDAASMPGRFAGGAPPSSVEWSGRESSVADPSTRAANSVATEATIEASLSDLERLWSRGFVTEEEYRSKRSEILARL